MALSIPLDVASLPAPVQRILAPAAPAPMRTMAARGLAPGLKPEHIVSVLVAFALGELPHVDEATRDQAKQTLGKLAPPVLAGALASAELPAAVIHVLAETYVDDAATMEKIVLHANLALETVLALAKTGNEAVTELVATNEERLLAHPQIIEALYMNKKTRMSTADRVLDLAVRNGKTLNIPAFKEAAAAILDELVLTEPQPDATPDDVLFTEAQEIAEKIDKEITLDAIFKEDDEGNEELEEKAKPLEQRIRDMTISQKIRTAMLGTAAARAILVRDRNRLVSSAVVRSPLIQEMEIAQFASSRSISEDVLRIIGTTGDLAKSHTVKFNLVANPKTPMAIAMRMLPHLRDDEKKKLAKSKNVSGQIARLAKQELEKKRPGG